MNIKLKNILGILLSNFIILGLGILILELFFGSWINPNRLNRLNIIRSTTIKYDISNLYQHTNKTVIHTRDIYGLRGSFTDPSEIDILTVGGSTTDQRYITDDETWQAVMEQKFKSIGKNIVVANAGISGQSTFGHIKNFEWWFLHIPNLKPKFILFYIGVNDLYKDAGHHFDRLAKDEKAKKTIQQQIKDNSALIYLARTLYGTYRSLFVHKIGDRSINFNEVKWTNKPLIKSYDKLMEKRLNAYVERLKILIKKTKQFGSIPIFVTQPSRIYRFVNGTVQGNDQPAQYDNVKINGVDFYYMISKLNAVTIEACKQNEAIAIDMAKGLILQDDDFYDFIHMTPKGVKKVGNYLYDKLKDKLG